VGTLPRPGGRRRPRLSRPPAPPAAPTARQRLAHLATAAGGAVRRSAPWWLPLLAGAAGALLAVGLLARDAARIGPATVRLSARPALAGSSQLAVPPFGSVAARTHLGPIAFRATVDDVDVRRLGQLLDVEVAPGRPPAEQLTATLAPLERRARTVARRFLVRIALLGVAGGAAAVLLFPRRSRRRLARCALGGVLATAALLVPTLASFDVGAFRAPRYEGALEYAPALIGDVRTGLDRLRTLREQMALIGQNLDRAYAALDRPAVGVDGGTVRILHVSDVHLNVAGFDLAERLADQFDVSAVVDTGDMGTWGFPPERRVARLVGRFKVPYLFVKGNHDDGQMVAAVAANRNARVLDGTAATVDGITFYGVGDPTFTPGRGYQVEVFEQLKTERSVAVADAVDALARRPDVLLVHDGRLAAYARGHVATVLDGHLHAFATELVGGTRTLQTGTVGGAGPDGLRVPHPPPSTAEILYFDRVTRRPIAVDRITVRSLESSFSVDRQLLEEGDRPFEPAPVPVPPSLLQSPPSRPAETPPDRQRLEDRAAPGAQAPRVPPKR
jgi:predicted phosphodiesterase